MAIRVTDDGKYLKIQVEGAGRVRVLKLLLKEYMEAVQKNRPLRPPQDEGWNPSHCLLGASALVASALEMAKAQSPNTEDQTFTQFGHMIQAMMPLLWGGLHDKLTPEGLGGVPGVISGTNLSADAADDMISRMMGGISSDDINPKDQQ